jgi:hypothetical protein
VIVAGVAIVALVFAFLVGLTVDAMGWKEAAAVWIFSLLMTAVIAFGAFLIGTGMQS